MKCLFSEEHLTVHLETGLKPQSLLFNGEGRREKINLSQSQDPIAI